MNKIMWILIFAVSTLMLFVFMSVRILDNFAYESNIEYSETASTEIASEDGIEEHGSGDLVLSAPAAKNKNYFSVVLGYVKEILTILSMGASLIMVFKKK